MTIYLADTSAWHRSGRTELAETWARRLAQNEIATCAQVRLEILLSAQSGDDYERIAMRLLGVRQLPCGAREFQRALEVQRSLAHVAGLPHRSVKILDLLIAASAEAAGAVVWHYDEDFDRIADVTGQPMSWVAPRGSL